MSYIDKGIENHHNLQIKNVMLVTVQMIYSYLQGIQQTCIFLGFKSNIIYLQLFSCTT